MAQYVDGVLYDGKRVPEPIREQIRERARIFREARRKHGPDALANEFGLARYTCYRIVREGLSMKICSHCQAPGVPYRRMYCSRTCRDNAEKAKRREIYRIRSQDTKVCPCCKETFHRLGKEADSKWARRTYCSRSCSGRQASKPKPERAFSVSNKWLMSPTIGVTTDSEYREMREALR